MRLSRYIQRQQMVTADVEPTPAFDESSGEPIYTNNIDVLTTNPPDLLLAPSAFVGHVTQIGRPGLGPDNEQLFQSGATNAEPINPSDEQGVGRSPGFRMAHYPHVQQFNPTILAETAYHDGELFVYDGPTGRESRSPIWPEGYLNYAQQPDQHQWWPSVATVNQPETPSFTETVPPIY